MKFLKVRIFSLFLDVGIWVYLFYGAFTIHYLATKWRPWQPEAKFVAPELSPLGWALVILVTLELVFFTRAFGPSLGQRIFGVGLVSEDGGRPSLCQRLMYFLTCHLALLSLGLGIFLRPLRPFHERWARVRLAPWPAPEAAGPRPRWYLTVYGLTGLLFVALTLALGWRLTEISVENLVRNTSKSLRIWRGLINSDFRYLLAPDPGIKLSLIDGLVQSLYMALFATVAGTALAFPLSFFGARNIMARSPIGWLVYFLTRGFFNIFRAVEATYWAAIFAIWVGFGPFAGSMALFLHTIAALGKLFSEQVEHIDPGPVEAVTAAGANLLQVVRYAVVPQVIPQFLAFTLYRWDINLRMATVVALVGGGGIGRHLFEYKDDLEWGLVGAVILLFMITVWFMDYVSGWVRERIV